MKFDRFAIPLKILGSFYPRIILIITIIIMISRQGKSKSDKESEEIIGMRKEIESLENELIEVQTEKKHFESDVARLEEKVNTKQESINNLEKEVAHCGSPLSGL